jgi:hypothetical protein
MEEAHTVWHQITAILGIKQCSSTQMLGICLEFWVGAGVAIGFIKIKALMAIKRELELLKAGKRKNKKKKGKKK